jgi:DNA ligase-1
VKETGQVRKPKAVEIQVLLAQTWDESIDPTCMLMSEKLDGVRAYWDASSRKLLSRQGNEFMAPAWFKDALPDFDLDGGEAFKRPSASSSD